MKRNLFYWIRRFDHYAGMFLMGFIILLANANVFMRYVVGKPWGWVEEVTSGDYQKYYEKMYGNK